MGLETGVNYIADLVSANPTIGDDVSVGDDHIRNIKRALQASLPKMGGIAHEFSYSSGATITISATKNHQIYATTYSGVGTAAIPAAATVGKGFVLTIVNHGADAGDFTELTLSGSDTFLDGNSLDYVRRGSTAMLVSDGISKWLAICGDTDFWKGYYRNLAESALQQGLHSIWLPISAATVPPSNAPALGQTVGANGIIINHYGFDKDVIETLQWTVILPQSHNIYGSVDAPWVTLKAEIYYTATGVGSCVWGVSAVGQGGSGTAWDIAFGTERTAIVSSAANSMIRGLVENIQPSGIPPSNYGKCLQLKLRRLATDGNDTLASDALLLGIRLYFNVHASADTATP